MYKSHHIVYFYHTSMFNISHSAPEPAETHTYHMDN